MNASKNNLAGILESHSSSGDVWVYCEKTQAGGLNSSSRELLGLAQSLAQVLECKVGAILIGYEMRRLADEAVAYGADDVYVADDESLKHFLDEPYSEVLTGLAKKYRPWVLLGGATAEGRALMPRVAVMLDTGLTADCTALDIDPEKGLLRQTRPAFGGNIMATITCRDKRPQMATVRPGVFPLPEADWEREGQVHSAVVYKRDLESGITWLSSEVNDIDEGDIRDAEIIVAAGKGVGGPEGVDLVWRLADKLGAAVGASRAVVDAGWLPYRHQVGQTGSTVQPHLYIACGVSGAIQHLVGMQSSSKIIAINKDPEAPIMESADVAVEGDVGGIVCELLKLYD